MRQPNGFGSFVVPALTAATQHARVAATDLLAAATESGAGPEAYRVQAEVVASRHRDVSLFAPDPSRGRPYSPKGPS